MLRALAVVALFCACTGGQTPPLPTICGCVSDGPVGSIDDCCDDVVCHFDDESNEWQVMFCDLPAPDPCDQCAIGSGEICVQRYDGSCGLTTACVPFAVDCPNNACSIECEQAYCNEPFQCQNRAPCGTESEVAFTCYGP